MFEMNCVWEPFEEQKIDLFIDLKPSIKWDKISGTKNRIETSQYCSYLEIKKKKLPGDEETISSNTMPMLSLLQNPEQYYLFLGHRYIDINDKEIEIER